MSTNLKIWYKKAYVTRRTNRLKTQQWKILNSSKVFMYRNFRSHRNYRQMTPSSNQPVRLYGTAKTHKFNSTKGMTRDNLKFRQIIDQTGIYTYKTARIIGEYLRPLSRNEYTIPVSTTLFWRPYDVVLTLWTSYGRQNNAVCLLGFSGFFM